jgi:hypothetical protein
MHTTGTATIDNVDVEVRLAEKGCFTAHIGAEASAGTGGGASGSGNGVVGGGGGLGIEGGAHVGLRNFLGCGETLRVTAGELCLIFFSSFSFFSFSSSFSSFFSFSFFFFSFFSSYALTMIMIQTNKQTN